MRDDREAVRLLDSRRGTRRAESAARGTDAVGVRGSVSVSSARANRGDVDRRVDRRGKDDDDRLEREGGGDARTTRRTERWTTGARRGRWWWCGGAATIPRGGVGASVDETRRGSAGRRGSAARAAKTRGVTVVANALSGGYGGGGRGFNIVPVPDRVVALVPYLLPLMSALRYGRFFFTQFPAAVILLKPLMPILRGVATLPMGNLIVFFAIYLGIAKNQNLSRFCRFNAMQAILLDIGVDFPRPWSSLCSDRASWVSDFRTA